MQWLVSNKIIIAGFGLALALVVAIGLVSFASVNRLHLAATWVTHTHQVRTVLHEILATLTAAESARRAYLITGAETHLDSYYAATQALEQKVERLRILTDNNPTQQQRHILLETLMAQRLALLEEAISEQQLNPANSSAQVEFTQQGQLIQERIRETLDIMETEELELLAERDEQLQTNLQNTILALAVGTALSVLLFGVFYWLNREITTRRQVEAALQQSQQELEQRVQERTAKLAQLYEQVQAGRRQMQLLSQQLLTAHETERRHIACELHDEIGQALTAVSMDLQMLQNAGDAAQLKSGLAGSVDLVDRILQQVRDLSLDLHPSMLDDLGLGPALRWYIDRQAQRAGFIPHFQADSLAGRLPPRLEIVCFRVVQEALTNVMRHAQASHVAVELRQQPGELTVSIQDDGAGFEVRQALERAAGGSSLGLVGLRERVEMIGGRLELESEPGRGATLRASFPLPQLRANGYDNDSNFAG